VIFLHKEKLIVEKYFDENLSENYYLFNFEKKLIKELLGSVKDKKCIDIGCGTGNYLNLFNGSKESYGVDFAKERVKEAIKKNKAIKKLKIFQADASEIPFEDEYFDIIFTREVIQHIPSANNRKKAFNELHRLLKKEGKLIFEFDNKFRLMGADIKGWNYFIRKYSPFEVISILEKKGFIIKKVYGLEFELLPLKKLGIRVHFLNKLLFNAPFFKYFAHKIIIYAEK